MRNLAFFHGRWNYKDGDLLALHLHLPENWTNHELTVFISHSSIEKGIAAEIKAELVKYGVYAFLAHEDVEPAVQWRKVILATLRSCHVFLALSSKNFNSSHWCQQEVGYALVASKAFIAIKIDEPPQAFANETQAITYKGAIETTDKLMHTLLKSTASEQTVTCLSKHLMNANTYKHASQLANLLMRQKRISAINAQHIRKAMAESTQVQRADYDKLLPSLEKWLDTCVQDDDDIQDPFA